MTVDDGVDADRNNTGSTRHHSENPIQISSPRLRPKLHSIPPLSLATPTTSRLTPGICLPRFGTLMPSPIRTRRPLKHTGFENNRSTVRAPVAGVLACRWLDASCSSVSLA
jgi:hypothetical protein